jgi:hypothetical protein
MTIKFKVLPQFPASVIGGNAITITKLNGNYTIDFDPSELAQFGTIADPTNTFVVLWNASQNVFGRVSLTDLKTILNGLP